MCACIRCPFPLFLLHSFCVCVWVVSVSCLNFPIYDSLLHSSLLHLCLLTSLLFNQACSCNLHVTYCSVPFDKVDHSLPFYFTLFSSLVTVAATTVTLGLSGWRQRRVPLCSCLPFSLVRPWDWRNVLKALDSVFLKKIIWVGETDGRGKVL